MKILDFFDSGVKRNVTVIPNGIDLNRCSPIESRENMRAKWGCSERDVIIGCIGRIDPIKNLMSLERVVNGIDAIRKVVVYGSCTPKVDEGKAIKSDLQKSLGNRIQFFDPTQDVGSVLNAIDVFFSPSYSEAMSLSTLEAWGAGVPVVSTLTGVIPELQEKYGKLVISFHPEANGRTIGAAIREAIAGQERDRILDRARDLVATKYNVLTMAREWTNLILKAANKSPRTT